MAGASGRAAQAGDVLLEGILRRVCRRASSDKVPHTYSLRSSSSFEATPTSASADSTAAELGIRVRFAETPAAKPPIL